MERLKSHRDFVTVLKRRHKVSDKDIVVHYLVRDDSVVLGASVASVLEDEVVEGSKPACRRIGLAVSKSVGHAVTRNTVKRRFRVLARQYESCLPAQCDVVLRAKPSAAHADFQSLDRQIESLFETVFRKVAKRER